MLYNGSNVCTTTTGVAPQLFASAIKILTAAQCFVPENLHPYNGDFETYDFIVVGGGSAGSVVANRLSEISHWKILLLEAGLEPPIESDVPFMAESLINTKYDWKYNTENDGVTHQGLKNGTVNWPRAKMLGGCSSINAMFYVRGVDSDYQAWIDAGNQNWTTENVNYYFRKAESFQNMALLENSKIKDTYGRKGPLIVNKFNSTYRDLTEKIIESWDYMGFKRVPDINSTPFNGLGQSGIFSVTAANGLRYSNYKSYIEPIMQRKNLKIVTDAFVTKILINEGNQAYGVKADIFGETKTFYARKEIIISAGTINTPQLLMLSGIGPKEHLEVKNISCLNNLPGVGKNLHDHNRVAVIIYGDEPGEENEAENLFETIKYMYNKTGLLAQNSFSDVTAFYSSNPNIKHPEFQNHLLISNKKSHSADNFFFIYRDDVMESFTEFLDTKSMYVFFITLLHPFSRGTIRLNSSNPYNHPIINANYFEDSRDLDMTVKGIKMLANIVETPYFRSINAFLHKLKIPECDKYKFKSDLYWKCYVITTSYTVYHPVGTAKMGPNPNNSVVDNFLKVHGMKGLRVIDASIMPSITSGNTNAPTTMIGEMGSDMIKHKYLWYKFKNSSITCSTTTGAAPQLFASAISFIAATQCFVPENPYTYNGDHDTYDFIVVGGGSAGSVVANRLSENKAWKVLLLEAGPEPPIESDIPQMAASLYKSKYDWQYFTENDGVHHQAFKAGSVFWPRGKMLGGCSSINAMVYIRGTNSDFKKWEAAGNPSWSPETVNSYFRKAENFQNTKLSQDYGIRKTYGNQGPLVINSYNSTLRDTNLRVLNAWDFMGFKKANDINSAKFKGFGISGPIAVTVANGQRYSTYKSYLKPIRYRENLKIVSNAFVTKILLSNDTRAYGVETDILGKKKTFYAKKEVIISTGTINTPQLLMLSGIGPEEHLLSKNISCIVNLPGVGKNLHDHNNVPIVIYGDEPGVENQAEQSFEAIKYMYNKTGFYAHGSFSDITALFSRNQSLEYPEFQSHLLILKQKSQSIRNLFIDYQDYVQDSIIELNVKKSLYYFILHLLHPTSRGSIYLNSSNPYDHPLIYPNYFGDEKDLQATVDGIKMLTKIVKTPYFKSINAFHHRVNISECNHHVFESDLYWACYVINICGTVYHPVGTAKMGPNPKDSVVDNTLKVHGVKGLRVIDASVMPTITSGNTNAPTIMIGEMGSDMIKADNQI